MKVEEKVEEKKGPVSILDKQFHARLLEDIERFADVAGVPVRMVHEPMATYCTEPEVEWITNIMLHREAGKAGLCLVGLNGSTTHPVETRMMAMASALLRNYVDARVVTMTTLLHEYNEGEVESPTVLLIPNFYITYEGGKPNTSWQVQMLQDLLMRRMVEKKITILYVQSMQSMREHYGEGLVSFINAHWTVL